MKWKTYIPKEGELKYTKRFAWFKTVLSDGFTVWLEYYYEVEQYRLTTEARLIQTRPIPTLTQKGAGYWSYQGTCLTKPVSHEIV